MKVKALLKYEGKDTFNFEGWEQGLTTERLQEALINHTAATDEKGICLFNQKSGDLKLIYKALGIDDT